VRADGKPIEGVFVTGDSFRSIWKQKRTYTDSQGKFEWDLDTVVYRFFRRGYEPLTIVSRDGKVPRRVVMTPDDPTSQVLPTCKYDEPIKIYEGGTWFPLPTGAKISFEGGGMDGGVTIVRFTGSKAQLQFGFDGGTRLDPPDEWFLRSTEFSQRSLHNETGKAVGFDDRGTKDGLAWRVFNTGTNFTGRYENASAEEATEFDDILARDCWDDISKLNAIREEDDRKRNEQQERESRVP
jgi:hypothetical protein